VKANSASTPHSPSPLAQSTSPPSRKIKSIPLKITSPIGIEPADVMQKGFHLYSIEDLVKVTEDLRLKHEDMKSLLSSRLRQTDVLQSY